MNFFVFLSLLLVVPFVTAQNAIVELAQNNCTTVLFLFTDTNWLPETTALIDEWVQLRRAQSFCVCVTLWGEAALPNFCLRDGILCITKRDDSGVAAAWGEQNDYWIKIGQRLPTVLAALESLPRHAGRGVMLMDSDVLLRRNIDARLRLHNAEIAIQQEWPCQTAPHQLCVNGGVWWARRSDGAIALLRAASDLMLKLRLPDMDALQIVAARRASSIRFLERTLYPNGYTAMKEGEYKRAHLIHVNWLKSVRCKQNVLRRARRGDGLVVESNCTLF